MRKSFFSLLMILAVLFIFSSALAADDGADPLTYSELSTLTEIVLDYAHSQEPILVPENEADITDDGYAFQYTFGTLYMNHPTMDEDAQLLSFVLSGELTACHDTYVGEPVSSLLAAYYTENEQLAGDYNHAVLYLFDNLPESASWAWVSRDGQRITSVQYSVHTLLEDGTYSDSGLLYNIESDTVDRIRLYGASSRISLSDVQNTLHLVAQSAAVRSYAAVPSSYDGNALTPFSESDLVFSGIDFLRTTPEDAVRLLGPAIEDSSMEDSDGTHVRMMDFGSCEIFFRYDASREHVQISSVTIGTDGLEGPRSIRVGDSFSSVLCRFRFGEGEYENGREVLYGNPDSGDYGLSEYDDNASATLRYRVTAQDGSHVLMMGMFEQMQLTELLIIRED
ncbi:MAG: hypothetical protein IJI38_03535 [Clostridia bacterium]|nr:hypothetical protein [Clostridia bacterium]